MQIGEKVDFGGELWRFDIWFIEKEKKETVENEKLIEEKLNEKNKITILKLKDMVKRKGLKIHGYDIYNAALKKGILYPVQY